MREGVAARERSSPRDRAMGTRLQAVLHAGEAGLGAWDAAPTGDPLGNALGVRETRKYQEKKTPPRPSSLVRQNTIGGITVADGQIEDQEWKNLKTRIQKVHARRLAEVEKNKVSASKSAVECIQELLNELAINHQNAIDDHNILIGDMQNLIDKKNQALKESQEQCEKDKETLTNKKDDEAKLLAEIKKLKENLKVAQDSKNDAEASVIDLRAQLAKHGKLCLQIEGVKSMVNDAKDKLTAAMEKLANDTEQFCPSVTTRDRADPLMVQRVGRAKNSNTRTVENGFDRAVVPK